MPAQRRLRYIKTLAAVAGVLLAAACGDEGAEQQGLDAGGARIPDARVVVPDVGSRGPAMPDPELEAVNPRSGTEAGGTRVVLRGTGFVEPAEVFFGASKATNVVVLDDAAIALTTPPGPKGLVTVRVVTAAGTSEKPAAYTYHRELRIDAIEPERASSLGGSAVTIKGAGFDDETVILLDRTPLIAAATVDAETITGYLPPLAPGRPEVWAVTSDANAKRFDRLVISASPELGSVAPGYGPLDGSPQALLGSGFTGAETVTVDGVAAIGLQIVSDGQAELQFPALPRTGAFTVQLTNREAAATLESAFIAYDPAVQTPAVLGVLPRRLTREQGRLTIVGNGLNAAMPVRVGGVEAAVVGEDPPHALFVELEDPLGPGLHAVDVAGVVLLDAIEVYAPPTLESVAPSAGSAEGGTSVVLRGDGFTQDTRVFVGPLELQDVDISATEIRGRTPPGAHGTTDITMVLQGDRTTVEGVFRYDEPFKVVASVPPEGSMAGNTLVTVVGRGFGGDASVRFDQQEGVAPKLENGSVLSVRAPPAPGGPLDLTVTIASTETILEQAYRYYNPAIITGGAWGGAVDGSVNVAVLDRGTGQPIPGIVVQLGMSAEAELRAVTDDNGLATVSTIDLRGAQTVTAGQNEVEHVTFMDLNARNLTVVTSRFPQIPEEPPPPDPCPMPAMGPVVRGKVFKFKSSLDPVTRPGWRAVAIVTYSDANVFTPNPAMPAEQTAVVVEDGAAFEIQPQRGGTIAVYAILGDLQVDTQFFVPRRMGIVRNVPSAPGEVTEGVNIALSIDLDKEIDVRLDEPPKQSPGPTTIGVQPYLNLESDGVIRFNGTTVFGDQPVRLTGLPNVAGANFFYLAGSWTARDDGTLAAPASITFAQSTDETEAGLDVGPFVQMPVDITPKRGEIAYGGEFSWDQPGTTPDQTTIYVPDSRFLTSCCCLLYDQDGECENQMCGSAPVPFRRWSVFGPGGLMSYDMPAMPPGISAFDTPRTYAWVLQQSFAPRFDYSEFVLNQFTPFFWRSWSIYVDQFVAKEETQAAEDAP